MKKSLLTISTLVALATLAACGDNSQRPVAPVVYQQPAQAPIVVRDNSASNLATGMVIGSMIAGQRSQAPTERVIERKTVIIREVPGPAATTPAAAPLKPATTFATPAPKPTYTFAPPKPTVVTSPATTSVPVKSFAAPAPKPSTTPVQAKSFAPSTSYSQSKPTVTYTAPRSATSSTTKR